MAETVPLNSQVHRLLRVSTKRANPEVLPCIAIFHEEDWKGAEQPR